MKRVAYFILALLALGLLTMLALRAKSPNSPSTAGQEKLQVISPHPQMIQDEFGPAFEAWYKARTGNDIKVVWRDMGGTSDDLRYIKSEFTKRAEGIDIDVFFGGGNDPYLQLKALGLLVPYKVSDEILSGLPGDIAGVPLYDTEYTWYGTAISGFGVLYNKVILTQLSISEPASWEGLADVKLFSWVGAGDPRHSGTVHMMYEIILQAYGWQRGWEIITAIGGNAKSFVQAASDIPRAVASGQVAVGGAIDFYAWTQIAQAGADKVGFAMPRGLTVVNTDSIGILKGAPNVAAARAFVEYVLTDGQKLWYLKAGSAGGPVKYDLFRMPVRKALYDEFKDKSPVTTNPFTWGESLKYDAVLGTARYEALNDLIGAVIVDSHDELVSAWKTAMKASDPQKALAALSVPPVTEEELTELAKTQMADAVVRNERISKWIDAAREKYKRLSK